MSSAYLVIPNKHCCHHHHYYYHHQHHYSLTLPHSSTHTHTHTLIIYISHFCTSSFPSGLLCPPATLSMSIIQLFEKFSQSKKILPLLKAHINFRTYTHAHTWACIAHIEIRVDRSDLDFCECFLCIFFA